MATSPIKSKNHFTPAHSDYGAAGSDVRTVASALVAGTTISVRLLNETLRTDNAHSMIPYLVVARITATPKPATATTTTTTTAAATTTTAAQPVAAAVPIASASGSHAAAAAVAAAAGAKTDGKSSAPPKASASEARYFTVQRLVSLNSMYYLQETDAEWKVYADRELLQWTDTFDFDTILNHVNELLVLAA